ncbi:MAG: PQQ-binding-like beta-propeller repeat protein [Planctomycetia bacterium]|nr:PQQ-binding-like beta-propeller repeat protein [Planctomycetia bacterium]
MQRYLAAGFVFTLWMAAWSGAAEPVGWRTNGTGAYPQAMPPKTWAADKNVVWRTKMPGFSNASPIIVGEKLFVCSEPAVLLCVGLADGKILWQKESAYQDVVLPPALTQKLAAEQEQADVLLKQNREIELEMAALRKKLALHPDNKDELQKQHEELRTRTVALKTKLNDYPLAAKFRTPDKNSVGGFSAPTPVSDGRQVFVAFGNGLVAGYDLAGNRQWLQLIEHSTAPYGHGASPLLVGDKLLIHYADLVALNIKDGSEAWRVKLPPNHGSPIHVRIGTSDLAIHPNGQLVRVADGAILADKLGSSGPNSPLLQDGVVYFIRPDARAVQLPAELSAPLKPEPLWKARLTGSGYWFASPVLHDGLIYGCNAMGILSVVEARSGQLVYEKRLPFGSGQVYPSITLAGGRLFISSDEGVTLVLQPGREYQELARNTLEPFRSTPVFQGKRMYVRGKEHLYCIGE